MVRKAILILMVLIYSTSTVADQVKIDTKDYLAFIVGNDLPLTSANKHPAPYRNKYPLRRQE
jgi:hypothetical protein